MAKFRRPRPIKRTWERIEERSTTAGRISEGARWTYLAALGFALFFFAGVTLWIGAKLLLNTASIPHDANGVIQSAQRPHQYNYELQTIRRFKIVDQQFERQSVLLVNLDEKHNKYQGKLVGASAKPMEFSFDGTTAGRKFIDTTDTTTANANPGISVGSSAIQSYPGPSVRAMSPPTPEDIARLNPKIGSDTASYRSVQCWRLDFKPDAILLKKLFPAKELGLQDSNIIDHDLEQISQGKYKTDETYVLVTRESRQMLLLTSKIELNNGNGYRFLLKYQNFNQVNLADFKLKENQ